ncbi:IS200/IS605 family transposase [Flavobacterium sp. IMCC34852]|uniref:IS200/IS605 family transposase n=1 Tax=Flavobacterium rivulicola TaxID=2732161 RepID=A0A7Y3R7K1_9FLAO|nr:IS200/IS605 family transposase [Flavobacterium sp. IMCC34852]NNT71291.1 IS200/IS605 family transposase [Flavobacterium sp. IMCC34852]
MANTYTQIHIQFVFAVKYRDGLIHLSFKDELYQYMAGIIKHHKHKLLVINGMPDHIHILVGMRPTQSLSDLMQDIKGSSSKWINERKFLKVKFEWQEGYGAFSYSKSQVNNVINYIKSQEQHHAKKCFRQEYLEFLELFEVVYDERYIFKDPI